MTKISRTDETSSPEKGGEVFDEFLKLVKNNEALFNSIVGTPKAKVEDVVAGYREAVGLDLVKTASEKTNKDGGLEYAGKDQETAKKVDLITLPQSVRGTNCFNCRFVKIVDENKGLGFCTNDQIQLPVTARMCCALWDNEGVKRSWEQESYAIDPIAPMKLKKVQSVDEVLENYKPEDLIVQQKYDGWKSQIIKNNDATKIYSRRGEEFQENVPELTAELNKKLDNGDFVLGEITYEVGGKQNISDLQSITGSNKEKALEFQKNNKGKVVLQAYDLLWNKGKNLTEEPYSQRYSALKSKIGKSADIQIPHNYSWSEKETAIKDALKAGGEGIVIKPKNSTYKYNTKGSSEPVGEWIKWKPAEKAHEEDVIVMEYEQGKGKLIFPAYQHQNGKLVEVAKVSGLPKEDEEWVKKQIDAGKQVVLEVGYQERTENGKLRHVGFHRVRKDLNSKNVKTAKRVSCRI